MAKQKNLLDTGPIDPILGYEDLSRKPIYDPKKVSWNPERKLVGILKVLV